MAGSFLVLPLLAYYVGFSDDMEATCDQPLLMRVGFSGCLVAAYWMFAIVARSVMKSRWTTFQLTQRCKDAGETSETFLKQAALNLVSFCVNCILGPLTLWGALAHVSRSSVPSFYGTREGIESCATMYTASTVGCLFLSYATFQTLALLVGWEKPAIATYVHHIIFFLLAVMGTYYNLGGEIGLFAMAQEASTPPLMVMLTFRRLVGHERTVGISSKVFAIIFMIVRPVLFTFAWWRSVARPFLLGDAEVYDRIVQENRPHIALRVMLALYTLGLILQWFWAKEEPSHNHRI